MLPMCAAQSTACTSWNYVTGYTAAASIRHQSQETQSSGCPQTHHSNLTPYKARAKGCTQESVTADAASSSHTQQRGSPAQLIALHTIFKQRRLETCSAYHPAAETSPTHLSVCLQGFPQSQACPTQGSEGGGVLPYRICHAAIVPELPPPLSGKAKWHTIGLDALSSHRLR